MADLLGAAPPSDAKGCLQDVHWSALAIGYFPSYLLGAMMAAQLDHHCRAALPDFEALVAAGDFAPILAWLREKVHDQGLLHPSMDELRAACGEPLEPRYYIEHLEKKYTALYGLDGARRPGGRVETSVARRSRGGGERSVHRTILGTRTWGFASKNQRLFWHLFSGSLERSNCRSNLVNARGRRCV